MIYSYRVTLAGIKGFYRIYEMSGATTLYDFHKQMRSDMEFAQDQLIMFKALNDVGGVVARYGLFDLGNGTVDKVTVEQTAKAGVKSFIYFYDVLNKKSVIVTLEGIREGNGGVPMIVDSKGPNPIEFENGYVAFEDLPDSQRHLPGQKPDWDSLGDDDDKDEDEGAGSGDDSSDEDDDKDDDDEKDDGDEDGKEVYDGTEDLLL
ncbi:MAG: hypothetical protein LKK12_07205 [Bacteroidales bacterium]|jgi:hypothetical protein|nr:hypothetical protein [Bacteroidales bacterium]MCI2134150.1 hypothetical protein [Bacteroidales bacterium]